MSSREGACFEDYMLYVSECTTCDSDEAIDDLDASTPSEWRAAAKSPLRGTAKRTRCSTPGGGHPLTLRRSSTGPPLAHSVSARIKVAFQESLGNQREVLDHEGSVIDSVQSLLLDSYACAGQRPNRMFSISADGLAWTPTSTCRDVLASAAKTALRVPLECLIQETVRIGTQFLHVELAVESLHPAKLVRPEESFVVERWSADGIIEHSAVVPTAPAVAALRRRPLSSDEALRRASYMSMLASHRLLRRMLDSVAHALLCRQELQCKGWSHEPTVPITRTTQLPKGGGVDKTVPMLLLAIQRISRELRTLMLPVGRIEQLLEASGLAVGTSSASPSSMDVEEASAAWIDTLTNSYGTLQATSCCGVPIPLQGENEGGSRTASTVISLLTVAVWPWLETFAWVIVGAVPHIDESSWADRCPSLFATRFEVQMTDHSTVSSRSSSDSAVSIAAGCEGIVRHQSWRNFRLSQQQAVKSVLSELHDALMGDVATQRALLTANENGGYDHPRSKGARATTAPLMFAAGYDVFRVACSYDALNVGVQCEPYAANYIQGEAQQEQGTLQVDFSVPATSWVSTVILRPLAREATRAQEHFVRELLVKPISTMVPAASLSDSLRVHNLSATFQESLEVIFHFALLEGWPSTGVAFVERVAALPPQWWASTPQLLASAFREACGATEWDVASTSAKDGSQRHLERGQWLSLIVDGPKQNEPSIAAHTGGLLQVIQSARLVWSFPEQHAVILLPHLYYAGVEGQVGDAYSRIFRLLTSLLLVKRGLVRLWKDQRWASSVGGASVDSSEGEGVPPLAAAYSSAAMHLAFVVNTLIEFVFSEVRAASSALREAVVKERQRVSNVCRAVDDFISHIDVVSLQSSAARSTGSQMMHQSIVGILRLSLDLCCAGGGARGGGMAAVSMDVVASRTKSAVSHLIAAIRSVPSGSPLCGRIHPLLLQLTFNRFFAEE